MVQLNICSSDGNGLFMTLLHLDVAMMPHSSSLTHRNSNQVMRKPRNRPSVVLRPKPPNPWRSISDTPLWSWHVSTSSSIGRSPSPPSPPHDLVNRCFDLVNTVYSSACTPACWCRPHVNHPYMVSLPVILISQFEHHVCPSSPSQSIGTTHLYLIFSISVDRVCAPYLHNIAKRHIAHTLMPWLVQLN